MSLFRKWTFLKIIQNNVFSCIILLRKPWKSLSFWRNPKNVCFLIHAFPENHQNHYTEWCFLRRKRYTGGRFRRPKTATCIAFPKQKPSLGIGTFDGFSKTLCFLKHAFSESQTKLWKSMYILCSRDKANPCVFWKEFSENNTKQSTLFLRILWYGSARFPRSHIASPRMHRGREKCYQVLLAVISQWTRDGLDGSFVAPWFAVPPLQKHR